MGPVLHSLTRDACRASFGCRKLNGVVNQCLYVRQATTHELPLFIRRKSDKVNPADKYGEKLKQKAISEGLNSVAELRKKYKRDASERDKVAQEARAREKQLKEEFENQSNQQKDVHVSARSDLKSQFASPIKKMSSYIDVDKLGPLGTKEIEMIWRARHAQKDNALSAVIPTPVYSKVEENAKRNPMFVLPLPREGQGVEMHLLQWAFPERDVSHLMMTSLLEYKTRGEYASPHTTISHHKEIKDDKGLVLMRGEVESDRGVSVDQAQFLLLAMQKFYAAEPKDDTGMKRIQMLEKFSQGSTDFKVESVIDEADKMV